MTARSIIAKGCVHLPRGDRQPPPPARADRPHASCARLVRIAPSPSPDRAAEERGHASTALVRWKVTGG